MKYLYGELKSYQISEYKKYLHKSIFWLLLYKDPETREKYSYVDFEKYFTTLMLKLDGFNKLMQYPDEILKLLTTLEAAHIESLKDDFNYSQYRKLILDAHTLLDGVKECD